MPPPSEPKARASDVTTEGEPVEVTWAELPPYATPWHVTIGGVLHDWLKSPLAPERYELEAWLASLPGMDEGTAKRVAEGFPDGDWFRPG